MIRFHYELLQNTEYSSLCYTVSPLHMNLQVANFQRCQHRSGSSKELELMPSMSNVSEIVLCPPSSIADDPSTLPPPTSPSFS